MPAVDTSKIASRRIALRRFDLFWLLWPYLPRTDVICSHSARAVRHYESRVYLPVFTFILFTLTFLGKVSMKTLQVQNTGNIVRLIR